MRGSTNLGLMCALAIVGNVAAQDANREAAVRRVETLIQERDRARERITDLEETLAAIDGVCHKLRERVRMRRLRGETKGPEGEAAGNVADLERRLLEAAEAASSEAEDRLLKAQEAMQRLRGRCAAPTRKRGSVSGGSTLSAASGASGVRRGRHA